MKQRELITQEQNRNAEVKTNLMQRHSRFPDNSSRNRAVANFRSLAEHDYHKKTLKSIEVAYNPNCNLYTAKKKMTADHLNTCPTLEVVRAANTFASTYDDRKNLLWAENLHRGS